MTAVDIVMLPASQHTWAPGRGVLDTGLSRRHLDSQLGQHWANPLWPALGGGAEESRVWQGETARSSTYPGCLGPLATVHS